MASTWTASKSITVTTEETVVIGVVADLVKPNTLSVRHTLRLASVGVSVTEVLGITISIIITAASMRALVTNRSRVHTVQLIIMTS